MGCQVQLSSEQPYFRTDKVKTVVYLHIIRAATLVTMSFMADEVSTILVGIGFAELVVAWWFWNLKMESWGLSIGVCMFQLLFPTTLGISLYGGAIILGVTVVQIALLGVIRLEGGYSYNHLAQLDQADTRAADVIQNRMYQLAVLAQIMKSFVVLAGGFVFLSFLGWFDPIPWLFPVPLVPVVFLFGFTDFLASYGFFTGRDWGFHLTLAMVPVSFIETLLTLNTLVFLLGVWILTILIPCLAKDGFYAKLFNRMRTSADRHTKEVIKTQKLTSVSDLD